MNIGSWSHSTVIVVGMLVVANLFMTYAWYGHLKHVNHWPWYVAALSSWGVALLEYLVQVPANRIGYQNGWSIGQLKIVQEFITLLVFMPFAVWYLKQPFRMDFVWASLCMLGAVYFVFRGA